MTRKLVPNSYLWGAMALITAVVLSGCSKNDSEKSKQGYWLPDAKEEQLPLVAHNGISFTGSKDQIKNQYKCTEYESTLSCKIKVDDKEDHVWIMFNEANRLIVIKRELGYFNAEQAQQIIERFTLKYGLDYEPTEGQESAFKAGLRKTKTYVFGKGQVAFQIGRSLNNRNELMLIYYFPEDVGATFAKSIQN
jgi:hypothetical protein